MLLTRTCAVVPPDNVISSGRVIEFDNSTSVTPIPKQLVHFHSSITFYARPNPENKRLLKYLCRNVNIIFEFDLIL
jgi:hypothetical protein